MKYMLDTNSCIFLMKNTASVVEHYKAKKHFGICISAIVAAELYFGIYNSANIEKNGRSLANFLTGLEIIEFDDRSSVDYGKIRAELKRKGQLIGDTDMFIAAHAKSLGLVLVTNNTREFQRVEGLYIEDWLQ